LTYAEQYGELQEKYREQEVDNVQQQKEISELIAVRNNALKETLSSSQYTTYMGYDAATKKSMLANKKKQQKLQQNKK
jgi:hypothetical protein